MSNFVFNQELANFLRDGLKQIQWLEDPVYIDERDIDDIFCSLKDHFEGSKFAEGHEGEDFDYWYDEFCEETLMNYLERVW